MEIPRPNEKARIVLERTSAQFVELVDAMNRINYFTQEGTDDVVTVMKRINGTPKRQAKFVNTLVFLAKFVEEIVGPRVDYRCSVEREFEEEP